MGKNRSLTIKDGQNKTLKEWHFADAATGKVAMTCKVKDIVGLKKNNGTITLDLYYSSNELPKGRQLASLVVAHGIRRSCKTVYTMVTAGLYPPSLFQNDHRSNLANF